MTQSTGHEEMAAGTACDHVPLVAIRTMPLPEEGCLFGDGGGGGGRLKLRGDARNIHVGILERVQKERMGTE